MNDTAALRADARRNIDRILDAAITCLSRDPDATMQQIAAEAGVGRVTAYAHFESRGALVEAALERAIERGDAALSHLDFDGDPHVALQRLVDASWELSALSANVWVAAHGTLSAAQIRALHDRPAQRARKLLERGQRDGAFRRDLPAHWLVNSLHALMKLGLDEVVAERLAYADAADFIARSAIDLWSAGAGQE